MKHLTAMDLAAFTCLYLNAACLAEQAVLLALDAALDTPADDPPGAPPVLPSADAVDWQALDGLSLGRAEAMPPAPAAGDADPVAAEADAAERAELAMCCALGPPAVYDAAAALATRIARLHARTDTARLAALAAALQAAQPAEAQPLTGRLDAAGFARWCARLAAGLPALDVLVAEVRSLDPPL